MAYTGYNETFKYSEEYSVLSDIEQYVINNDTDNIIKRVKSVKVMPEVFFCSNDNVAIQMCNSLKVLGYQIPEDISVMGCYWKWSVLIVYQQKVRIFKWNKKFYNIEN